MSNVDFRLGNLTGRLAGMVGASWKGINYVRKMVIPANPNTVAQQGTRTVFSWLVEKGRRINSTILKLYMIPKPKKMSGFNKFISNNKSMIEAGAVTIADMVIAKGSLFIPPDFVATADEPNDKVDLVWSALLRGEALATDPVIIVVYNEELDVFGFETSKTRNDATASVDIDITAVGQHLHAWMFAVQGETLSTDTSYSTDVS